MNPVSLLPHLVYTPRGRKVLKACDIKCAIDGAVFVLD